MPKKELTEMEALILCRRHWMWMKKHGAHWKGYYFDAIGLSTNDTPYSECWACEYMDKVDPDRCNWTCIVNWGGEGIARGCSSNPNSAWNEWLNARGKEEKSKAAGRILWRVEKSIKLLKEKQNAEG